jgi:putative ABC transport system substrate-binding protein
MGVQRRHPEAGALMSYGPNIEAVVQRAAVLVSKVLQDSKPGDLPVEQPTKYDFIINLKTANVLGITISPTVLYQATRVLR